MSTSTRKQAIVDLIDAAGGTVTWTNQELAEYLGLSCSATRIAVALRELEAAGSIVVVRTTPHPQTNRSGRRIVSNTKPPF